MLSIAPTLEVDSAVLQFRRNMLTNLDGFINDTSPYILEEPLRWEKWASAILSVAQENIVLHLPNVLQVFTVLERAINRTSRSGRFNGDGTS